MTLEELWQLFPITLSPPNAQWTQWAHHEIAALSNLLASHNPVIEHIGSTAIKDIIAKPIIDILVLTDNTTHWDTISSILESNNYIPMSRSSNRMSFNKGYTPDGYAEKVFHVHFHLTNDRNEIIFRDFLNAHPEVAKEYEKLKLSLLPQFTHDRDGYTAAKSQFISDVLSKAQAEAVKI